MNPKRLFVGNLTYTVDEKELWGLFSRYGEVVGVRVLEGKGYGFVEMESYEGAQAAKNALNETEFKGRNLLIDDVRPKSKPGFQKGPTGKRPSGRPTVGRSYSSSGKKPGDQDRQPYRGSQDRRSSKGPGETRPPERVFKSAPRPPGRKPVTEEKKKTWEKPANGDISPQKRSKTRFWPGGKQ
jgi:RNA recognition motif-containing protein